MKLPQAQSYAEKILNWIMPYAWPAQVAGSIRRHRPVCNDIDIVCIPKIDEQKDILGAVIARENLLTAFLNAHVAKPENAAKIISQGPRQMVIELKRCQLDLWFADEKTIATKFLCRTGSKEHNVWLAARAKKRGMKWNPYEGIWTGGKWLSVLGESYVPVDNYAPLTLNQFATEAELYAFLDLPWRCRRIFTYMGPTACNAPFGPAKNQCAARVNPKS